jgi:hypothetical protein
MLKDASPRFNEICEAAEARGMPEELRPVVLTLTLIAMSVENSFARTLCIDAYLRTMLAIRPDFKPYELEVVSLIKALAADFNFTQKAP